MLFITPCNNKPKIDFFRLNNLEEFVFKKKKKGGGLNWKLEVFILLKRSEIVMLGASQGANVRKK